ncbi:MAG TPA: thymidine phosphorylase family protein [Pyrinomonadaceae bacterium]|nr:thymidine phosphorylase family protein [Pyrinomonadaceae bacterium]
MKKKNEKIAQNLLRLKRLGIDSRNEHLVFMRRDCHVCVAEGFEALSRIRVAAGGRELVASLIVLENPELLEQDEIGLSKGAIKFLRAEEGDLVRLSHLGALDSMSDIRRKIYGHPLDENAFRRIVTDTIDLSLSNIQLSAFLTACTGERLSRKEVVYLTEAMIEAGEKLRWDKEKIFDKHSVGGLPGNRTTPIVVSIAAAAGLTIPKTSSRAITSPAGTADTMETLTNVDLGIDEIRRVVEREGGCLAWGGAVKLSPADDILVRVQRALDIDSEGQMIASVLSKKAAAGSTSVVIDIPVGPTAKVRSREAGESLAKVMSAVGREVGLQIDAVITDGSQPVGRGIGPALEARDVLAVLKNEVYAPEDLAEKSLMLAGRLIGMARNGDAGSGYAAARGILESGEAWEKFVRICEAQGGLKQPPTARHRFEVKADRSGTVFSINNRKLSRTAKLSGAPGSPAAGILLNIKLDDPVRAGDTLFEVHAEADGELAYSLEYLKENTDVVELK